MQAPGVNNYSRRWVQGHHFHCSVSLMVQCVWQQGQLVSWPIVCFIISYRFDWSLSNLLAITSFCYTLLWLKPYLVKVYTVYFFSHRPIGLLSLIKVVNYVALSGEIIYKWRRINLAQLYACSGHQSKVCMSQLCCLPLLNWKKFIGFDYHGTVQQNNF